MDKINGHILKKFLPIYKFTWLAIYVAILHLQVDQFYLKDGQYSINLHILSICVCVCVCAYMNCEPRSN